jgi:hypothetical protein
MSGYTGRVTRGGCTHNTFRLLWCESCGRAEEPPPLPNVGIIGSVPLTCDECGDELTLLEAFVRGTHTWAGPGHPHRSVAHLHDLASR